MCKMGKERKMHDDFAPTLEVRFVQPRRGAALAKSICEFQTLYANGMRLELECERGREMEPWLGRRCDFFDTSRSKFWRKF